MSDSVVPVAFPRSDETERSKENIAWMQVSRGGDVEPVVWPDRAGGRTNRGVVDATQPTAPKAPALGPQGEGARAAAPGVTDGSEGGGPEEEPVSEAGEPASAGSCPVCAAREAEIEADRESYRSAVRDMVAAQHRDRHALEGALIELSLSIAGALAEGMAEVNPELHQELARVAVACLVDGTEDEAVRLRVGPLGHQVLKGASEDELGFSGSFELLEDASIAGAGCMAESSLGRVDGTVETRLAQVGEALRDAWNRFGVEKPA